MGKQLHTALLGITFTIVIFKATKDKMNRQLPVIKKYALQEPTK